MQEKNQKKNKKKGYLLIFGILLIFISIGILVNKYYQRNEIQNVEENKLEEFYEIQEEIMQDEVIKEDSSVEQVKIVDNVEP